MLNAQAIAALGGCVSSLLTGAEWVALVGAPEASYGWRRMEGAAVRGQSNPPTHSMDLTLRPKVRHEASFTA